MKNTTTNDLTLFSIHATMRTDPGDYGAIFVVAAKDKDDSIECVREFLGDQFNDCDVFKQEVIAVIDPIGLAAGSVMRPDAIYRGVVVSSTF